jgi:hypothetical protein
MEEISSRSYPFPTNSDSGSIDNMNKQRSRSDLKKHAAYAALSFTLFLAALDTVLIATALPTIAAQFSINDAGYAWVGSAYLLTVSQYHSPIPT